MVAFAVIGHVISGIFNITHPISLPDFKSSLLKFRCYMRIPPVKRISIVIFTRRNDKAVSMDGAETERAFSGSCYDCSPTCTGLYDVRYLYVICEIDCRVLSFSNRSSG